MANKRVSLKGKGADLFFGDLAAGTGAPPEAADAAGDSQAPARQPVQPSNQSTGRSAGRLTRRSTKQSTDQPTKPSRTLDRPKAFYITERLDSRLDDAVRYFQQVHSIKKVDRSIIVNAILDNDEQWSEESLDSLVDRVIGQLTSRLTGR
ncbi:MAG: hypothetical protein JOZ41_20685 [Chloroflexi bacterium]|nr:hypothetical protein [Chloroflexota bacterium]